MSFEVIDNFLSDYHFKSIINPVLRADFNWNFNDHVVKEGTGDFQFTHNVFSCKEFDKERTCLHDHQVRIQFLLSQQET